MIYMVLSLLTELRVFVQQCVHPGAEPDFKLRGTHFLTKNIIFEQNILLPNKQ